MACGLRDEESSSLFVRRAGTLKIGHITDTHVDVRADVTRKNLNRKNVARSHQNGPTVV